MLFNTLSGRFLGLTIIFVMIAEVLIFVPSVARFRLEYVQNKVELAQLAALALLATPEEAVAPDLESELLQTAGVLNVVLRREGIRELVLSSPLPDVLDATYDLTEVDTLTAMRNALAVFARREDRILRFIGRAEQGSQGEIEIVIHEAPLRTAMIGYGLRILVLSLVLSIATAAILFLAVQRLIVVPMQRVVDHMTAYRDDPEDPSRIIEPSSSARELRQAETALHDLQLRLTGALRQKERLAALGGAVAKISHDLRNMLTTAQLIADRLETSADPAVQRTAPKLVASLARAINLCERTLTYGRAEEPPPVLADVPLHALVEELITAEGQALGGGTVQLAAEIEPGLRVRADPEQLYRILLNLMRNAIQAIDASGSCGTVTVVGRSRKGGAEILVKDTGPGLPEKARQNLFQPFLGGARRGGSGLGLVIAGELVRGHGGELTLESSGPSGTVFRIHLPSAG